MTSTPGGWYPDPENASISRWWDGNQWTDYRAEPYSRATAAADLRAPEGTPPYTAWIWLIIALLALPSAGLMFIDWDALMNDALESPGGAGGFAMYSDPAYLLTTLSGWISYGLCALFAYFDWRELKRRGVPKPFHFAWVFLYAVPYVIGRSVVVRRRIGRGIAPMWVSIALMVASFGLVIYVTVVMVVGVFDQVSAIDYGSVSPGYR